MEVKRLKALCTVPRNYLAVPAYIKKHGWKTRFVRFALLVSSGVREGDSGQGIAEKQLYPHLSVSEEKRWAYNTFVFFFPFSFTFFCTPLHMPPGQGKDTEDKYWGKVSTYLLREKILADFQMRQKCLKSQSVKLKDYFLLCSKKWSTWKISTCFMNPSCKIVDYKYEVELTS